MASNVSEKTSFTEINLVEHKQKKLPKRLVYFSDGILEEYSSEDEVDNENLPSQPLVDPKTLPWIPYFGYYFWWMGARTLAVCDYLGENLAWFLGITSPKFQYELDQFEKMAKEEEELQKHIKEENAGWSTEPGQKDPEAIALQPVSETPEILVKKDVTFPSEKNSVVKNEKVIESDDANVKTLIGSEVKVFLNIYHNHAKGISWYF